MAPFVMVEEKEKVATPTQHAIAGWIPGRLQRDDPGCGPITAQASEKDSNNHFQHRDSFE
jgi:hypothetical protein